MRTIAFKTSVITFIVLGLTPALFAQTDLIELSLAGSRTPAEYGFDMKFWLGHLVHGDNCNGTTWASDQMKQILE